MLVIGLGNRLRGDDGAGPAVARLLRAEPGIEVHEHGGEADGLLALWEGAAGAVIVDAVRTGTSAPGTIMRFDAVSAPLPAALARPVGHSIGLAEALELGRVLERLPPAAVVFGIEGQRFGLGEGLSAAVARAIGPLARIVLAQARALASARQRSGGVGTEDHR